MLVKWRQWRTRYLINSHTVCGCWQTTTERWEKYYIMVLIVMLKQSYPKFAWHCYNPSDMFVEPHIWGTLSTSCKDIRSIKCQSVERNGCIVVSWCYSVNPYGNVYPAINRLLRSFLSCAIDSHSSFMPSAILHRSYFLLFLLHTLWTHCLDLFFHFHKQACDVMMYFFYSLAF